MARRIGMSRAAVMPCPLGQGTIDAQRGGAEGHRILLVGSVQPRKGVDVWAHSLNTVLRRRPDVRAELIGPDTATGPGGGSMIDSIREIIAPDLRHRFIWRGVQRHEDIAGAIASASLVVVPSRFESFGYAGAEALLRGRPVLLSDQVGLAEWTGPIPTVPAGDADALARGQLRVLADLPAARRDSARCRAALLEACAPSRCLEARASFVAGLARGASRITSGGEVAQDAMGRMQRFIGAVENAERVIEHDVTSSRGMRGHPAPA
jgi:glycosyltransferase involved in cell wall biosynthesis